MNGSATRWRRSRAALVELVVLLGLAAGVLWMGSWVGEPVPSLVSEEARRTGCTGPSGSPILRLELAVPDEDGEEALPTIEDLLACADRKAVARGLRESTQRDFAFIAAYGLLLTWCAARLGGLRGRGHTEAEPEAHPGGDTAGKWPGGDGTYRSMVWEPEPAGETGEAERPFAGGGTVAMAGAGGPAGPAVPARLLAAWRDLLESLRSATGARTLLARVDRNNAGRLVAQVAAWSVPVAGALDVIENVMLLRTASAIGRLAPPDPNVVKITAGCAAAKFVLLLLPVILGFWLLGQLLVAAFRSRVTDAASGAVLLPDPDQPGRRWAVPVVTSDGLTAAPAAEPGAYGICFSGGGIRSATFALGALQELESTATHWNISHARYLSAVSGGSYMAAAYQFLAQGGRGAPRQSTIEDLEAAPNAGRRALARLRGWPLIGPLAGWLYGRSLPGADPDAEPAGPAGAAPGPLVPPAGPVEDHLRRHATHLADGAAEWIQAIAEVLIRAVTGLAVLLLLVWTAAVPLGWAFRYVFHGLRDGEPAVSIDLRIIAGPAAAFLLFAGLRLVLAKPADSLQRRLTPRQARPTTAKDQVRAATSFAVALLVILTVALPFVAANVETGATTVGRWAGLGSTEPDPPDPDAVSAHLDQVIGGTSAAAAAAAKAAVTAGDGPGTTTALQAAGRAAELAARQARDAVAALARLMDDDETGVDDGVAAGVLAVPFDPTSCAPTAPPGAPPVAGASSSVAVRACEAGRAAAAAAAAVGHLAALGPPSRDGAGPLAEAASSATAGASAASVAVRKLAGELAGTGDQNSRTNPPVAWAGLSALVSLIGGLAARRRMDVATRAPGGESKSNRFARMVGFGGIVEVLAGILTGVLAVIAVSDVVVDSWQRGALGQMKIVTAQPAWRWWLLAAALLAAALLLINANNWSMRPFYHRRLWLPYAVTPSGRTAGWHTDTRLSAVGRRVEGYPELLVCAAAQTSGREWAPPGRRALSFVFTADAVGGPEIGYVHTRKLEAMLGAKHRQPITLFGAVAASGAAFGPAMGRHSKGGLGAVIAIANARLGAWLPNPRHLAELARVRQRNEPVRAGSFARWPRLWYWFREIVGQYPDDSKLVLATDGGHYENLGLIELLRRRCERIFCFDASGAGATPTTLAEAIVLAREELGVTITLRPPTGGAAPAGSAAAGEATVTPQPTGQLTVEFTANQTAPAPPPPPLLQPGSYGADPMNRRASMVEALVARIAGRAVLVADIVYPAIPGAGAAKGVLVYGTLALADDGPEEWDLLEYGHRNTIFPNDGTGRQWFDAATFSAYQQLGRRTAVRMVAENAAFAP